MKSAEIIKSLRQLMKKNGVDAYVIMDSDPHLNEMSWSAYCYRTWVTGFDGSVGTVVLTQKDVNVWTDGRYITQVALQTKGKGFKIFQMKIAGIPTWEEWVIDHTKKNGTVAVFGDTMDALTLTKLNDSLKEKSITLKTNLNFVPMLGNESFARNDDKPVYSHKKKYSGATIAQKLKEVRAKLAEQECDYQFMSTLDDIAWLYNYRCDEDFYSPVTFAHTIVSKKSAVLFAEKERFEKDLLADLKKAKVDVQPYENVSKYIKTKLKGSKVLLEAARVNYTNYKRISSVAKIKDAMNISSQLKTLKNKTELANIRDCLIDDGIALVRFYMWLEDNLGKRSIDEVQASDFLDDQRYAISDCRGLSFGTIMAYGSNAAMMHYHARKDDKAVIKQKGLLLIDSGGFYLRGTTDTTRTIQVGPVTKIQKRDYSLVLKSMINLTQAQFFKGTTGKNLDVLARNDLWKHGIQYHCGTGHGVGMFLNVHEGPQSFSHDARLEVGMLITNEPGVYKPERYGIRTENIMVVEERESNEFGTFYGFETLTRAPIDTRPIDKDVLGPEATAWLNRYHKKVYKDLAPRMSAKEKSWLKARTKPI